MLIESEFAFRWKLIRTRDSLFFCMVSVTNLELKKLDELSVSYNEGRLLISAGILLMQFSSKRKVRGRRKEEQKETNQPRSGRRTWEAIIIHDQTAQKDRTDTFLSF